MIYSQDIVVDAFGVAPTHGDPHGLVVIYETATPAATLRVAFHQHDDEALIEWFLPSGRCGTRIRLRQLETLRCVQDPRAKFLEVSTANTTVEIWFQPEPRLHILAPANVDETPSKSEIR